MRNPGPTIRQMAGNFTKALLWWAAKGFLITTEQHFWIRLHICRKCEDWDEKARKGLGKCNHKKCGCTKLKLWMRTEKCPAGKWDNIDKRFKDTIYQKPRSNAQAFIPDDVEGQMDIGHIGDPLDLEERPSESQDV